MNIYTEKNQRTKKRIEASFLHLLECKPFEAITIGEIAKLAEMNRGTFYLHYEDKFALLEQIEQNLFLKLGDHIDELQSRYAATDMFEQEQKQVAETLFRFIQLNAPLLKVLLSGHGRAGFHLRFRDAFSKKVRLNLEKNERFVKSLNVPIEYFLAFITSAFLGLIEQWLQNDVDKTAEEMTVLYIEIIAYIKASNEK